MTYSKNVRVVLDILKNEVDGDIEGALKKMTDDYSMTWMYKRKDVLFPATEDNVTEMMREAYPIKGRSYDIKNIAENENTVMIEVIESYPDPETGEIYRTPEVIVIQLENGKIKTGRHYTDPQLSHEGLKPEQITKALKGLETKITIN